MMKRGCARMMRGRMRLLKQQQPHRHNIRRRMPVRPATHAKRTPAINALDTPDRVVFAGGGTKSKGDGGLPPPDELDAWHVAALSTPETHMVGPPCNS